MLIQQTVSQTEHAAGGDIVVGGVVFLQDGASAGSQEMEGKSKRREPDMMVWRDAGMWGCGGSRPRPPVLLCGGHMFRSLPDGLFLTIILRRLTSPTSHTADL